MSTPEFIGLFAALLTPGLGLVTGIVVVIFKAIEIKRIAEDARDAAQATNGSVKLNIRRLDHIEGFLQGAHNNYEPLQVEE